MLDSFVFLETIPLLRAAMSNGKENDARSPRLAMLRLFVWYFVVSVFIAAVTAGTSALTYTILWGIDKHTSKSISLENMSDTFFYMPGMALVLLLGTYLGTKGASKIETTKSHSQIKTSIQKLRYFCLKASNIVVLSKFNDLIDATMNVLLCETSALKTSERAFNTVCNDTIKLLDEKLQTESEHARDSVNEMTDGVNALLYERTVGQFPLFKYIANVLIWAYMGIYWPCIYYTTKGAVLVILSFVFSMPLLFIVEAGASIHLDWIYYAPIRRYVVRYLTDEKIPMGSSSTARKQLLPIITTN